MIHVYELARLNLLDGQKLAVRRVRTKGRTIARLPRFAQPGGTRSRAGRLMLRAASSRRGATVRDAVFLEAVGSHRRGPRRRQGYHSRVGGSRRQSRFHLPPASLNYDGAKKLVPEEFPPS